MVLDARFAQVATRPTWRILAEVQEKLDGG
jgi:hypothetical protein